MLAHELFSAMPPWEIFKVLLGLLVSDNVPGAEGEELEMAMFDISRAHFMAPMDREACIELPEEDKLPEDGDAVGLLQRSMFGFRTASANWMKDWPATLEEGGYKVGVANPALFHRSEDGSRGGVHGDDFAVVGSVGSRRTLDRMGKTLSGKYSMRESHRLGFGSHCESHAELLNRIVSVETDSDGRRYVRIEPDIRHAELVFSNLGLEGSKAKRLTTPRFKVDEKELALREKEVPLDSQRCCEVQELCYEVVVPCLDRADLGEPVKCLVRSMAKPTPGSLRDSRKLHATCWGPKTWLFICGDKRFRSAFQLTLRAILLDAV